MSELERAKQSFRAEVARAYGKDTGDITVHPKSEKVVHKAARYDVGDLRALRAELGDKEINGFADAEGAVVLRKTGELGPLMEAAKILDEKASLSAVEIAERIAWVWGHSLVKTPADYQPDVVPPKDLAGPEIEREDGSARLHFFTLKEDDDPGFFMLYEGTVKVGADYSTQIEMKYRRD